MSATGDINLILKVSSLVGHEGKSVFEVFLSFYCSLP